MCNFLFRNFLTSLSSLYEVLLLADKTSKNIPNTFEKMGFEIFFLYAGFLYENNQPSHQLLSKDEKRRRDRRTKRVALRYYTNSSFYYLFHSGDDQSLLNCCAVDHRVFRSLLDVFQPIFHQYMVDEKTGCIRKRTFTREGLPKGRRRQVDATCCLGLVLYWYRTRGSVARSTSMAFGLTATPMYKWIKFGRRILLFVLHNHPSAKIRPPSQEELDSYVSAIGAKYPVLEEEKVWGAADGLKIRLQRSSDWSVQNKYYNGWKGATFVNSVFVFAPDGCIRICTLNAPGTFHDSTMAEYGIYDKMEQLFMDSGVRIVVDSAFNLAGKPYLIQSSQDDPVHAGARGVTLNRAATSVRQLSEHGMRMIQGQFPRLKDAMVYEEFGERRVILNVMVLLYNYQTNTTGINHILNSFMSKTEGFHSYGYNITATANDVFHHEQEAGNN